MSAQPAPASPIEVFLQSPLGRELARQRSEGSAHHRRIAEFALRNPVMLASCGVEELAQATGTSAPTISRFARSLGFAGTAELRALAGAALAELLQPVDKLRASLGQRAQPALAAGAESTALNLQQASTALTPARLAQVAALLCRAQTVYVMGFGLSSHLAGILSLDLEAYLKRMVNVVEFGGSEVAAGRLMGITKRDVLVSICLPRYGRDALALTGYARDRGARVVAITDGPASPIAPLATHLLAAPVLHPVLSASLVGPLSVVEALAAAVMVSRAENVEAAAKLGDAIAAYLVQKPTRRRARCGVRHGSGFLLAPGAQAAQRAVRTRDMIALDGVGR